MRVGVYGWCQGVVSGKIQNKVPGHALGRKINEKTEGVSACICAQLYLQWAYHYIGVDFV